MKRITIRQITTAKIAKILIYLSIPNPNPEKSKADPLRKFAIPLPSLGFSKKGFSFGAFCASPTG